MKKHIHIANWSNGKKSYVPTVTIKERFLWIFRFNITYNVKRGVFDYDGLDKYKWELYYVHADGHFPYQFETSEEALSALNEAIENREPELIKQETIEVK